MHIFGPQYFKIVYWEDNKRVFKRVPVGTTVERVFREPFPYIALDEHGVPLDRGGRLSSRWWRNKEMDR